MYQFLTALFPQNLKKRYIQLVEYSSLEVNPLKFIGFTIIIGILLSLTASTYVQLFFKKWFLITFVSSFAVIEVIIFLLLYLSADKKAKFVDTILPDALQILASDLRAGMTTDKALLLTARSEFGPLKKELDRASHEIALGTEITQALGKMLKRINSERLSRTIFIINTGIRSGGSLAPLLEQTSEDLRKQDIIESKINASIGMYTIFIFIAVGFASPGLFALSYILVQVLTSILGNIEIPKTAMATVPISVGGVNLSLDFLFMFIMIFIFSNCFFGSLILGAVSKGKSKRGIVFLPLLLIMGYIVFFVTRKGLTMMFGDLFGL